MFWLARILPAAFVLTIVMSSAMADMLATIKAKGEIVVGTRANYAPFGFKDKDGNITGFEPELAADLARRLGVKLRIEPVTSAMRIPMLQEGKIDLLIATLGVTDERMRMVGYIDPAYYAANFAALSHPQAGIESEADLNEKSVCAVKGDNWGAAVRSYVKDPVIVNSVPDAKQALLQGRCVTFVTDSTLLRSLKTSEAETWKDYRLVEFTDVDPRLFGIAVRLEDRASDYSKLISAAIIDWHHTGWLVDVEKKWLGANTPWVVGLREKYRRRTDKRLDLLQYSRL